MIPASIDWVRVFSTESIPFVAMGAIATVQGVTGVAHLFKSWQKWRKSISDREELINTDYHRVTQGETRGGWHLILPKRILPFDGAQTRHRIISLGWTPEESGDWFESGSTILIRSVIPLPDGKKIAYIRRYSIFNPEKIYADLARVVYDPNEWSHQITCYLTAISIASVFRFKGSSRLRIVVSDAYRRRPSTMFSVESPVSEADVHLIHSDKEKNRIEMIFGRWVEQEPLDELDNEEPTSRFEIWIVSYSISPTDNRLKDQDGIDLYYSTSAEAISVPTGDKDVSLSFPINSRSLVMFLYGTTDLEDLSRHMCVSYDRSNGWKIEKMNEWKRRAEKEYDRDKTSVWRMIKLMESFRDLNPLEGSCRLIGLPMLQYGVAVEMRAIGVNAFAITKDGVFRRWVSAPTLMYTVAESLYRSEASPAKEIERERLKMIGFDIFSGVPELSEDDESVPMINVNGSGM